MKPNLQEQLSYLSRIINPDYIIIVQNKANQDMNFNEFKPVIPISREQYKPQKRYTIITLDEEDGMKKILVKDCYVNNRVVYEGICKEKHLQDNLDIVKSLYKGSSIEDKI